MRSDDIVRNSQQEHKSRALGFVYINAKGFLHALGTLLSVLYLLAHLHFTMELYSMSDYPYFADEKRLWEAD